jgi:4a-hydroxytetrahydrobiopterin dehydratase
MGMPTHKSTNRNLAARIIVTPSSMHFHRIHRIVSRGQRSRWITQLRFFIALKMNTLLVFREKFVPYSPGFRFEPTTMTCLTTNEIAQRLHTLPGWIVYENQLSRTFEFKQFPAGINFVDGVAELAEAAMHHPDIDIRYTKITIRLSTHDAGGITAKDFSLATEIATLFDH